MATLYRADVECSCCETDTNIDIDIDPLDRTPGGGEGREAIQIIRPIDALAETLGIKGCQLKCIRPASLG